jgi:hypothetical protein
MPGKRKKDPEYYQLKDTLEQLLNIAEAYRARLEAELAAEQGRADAYLHLVRPLERQIEALKKLEAALDQSVWPMVIEIANTSAYIEHARTRDYF